MRRNTVLGWMGPGLAVGLALGLAACGNTDNKMTGGLGITPTAGVTGTPGPSVTAGMAAPVGTATSGAAATAPTAGKTGTATAGTPAQTGSSGSVAPGSSGSTGSTAGATAAAGAGGSTGTAGTPASSREDLGKGDGKDVVTIGDSWMNIATNGGGIEGGFDRLMTSYRHYAVAGTTLLTGQIPSQYDQAKAVNPKISTVIMTGGGNDVMFSGGCATKEACEMSSQAIADGLDKLWTVMAADGVQDVIYIRYSKYAGTSSADVRPTTAPVPAICLTGKIRCYSVGTDDEVMTTGDGIHPLRDGCDKVAKKTMDLMVMNGIRR